MDENPYKPATVSTANSSARLSGWRIFPAAFLLFLGLLVVVCMVIGLALAITLKDVHLISDLWVGILLLLAVSFLWIYSAGCFWWGRYRRGVYIAVAAFALFVILWYPIA